MKKLTWLFCLLLFSQLTTAQTEQTTFSDMDSLQRSVTFYDQEIPIQAGKELKFIAYFFNQTVSSNFYPTNEFLQGQVIGRMFGRNTSKTSDENRTFYTEQRLLPFFLYTPKLMDGKVTLRGSFEIDWTWGDASYGSGGNQGAGFNADQVNIQTQNIEIEIIPKYSWAINIGLQRMYDTPYNPYRVTVDRLQYTGYRLFYWAGDAPGINVRKDFAKGSLTAGVYSLSENRIELDDDVVLVNLIGEKKISPQLKAGGSFYYINDRSSGIGGASIFGQGPKSLLTEYMGAYRFNFPAEDYVTNVMWAGGFFGYNDQYAFGNHKLTGFVNTNFGSIKDSTTIADILGVGANLRYSYRYGKSDNDEVYLDGIFTSGDEDGLEDDTYNGVITGNTWGAPGNLPISTGSYIMFPSGNVVNRYMPLVADISNMGYGLIAINGGVKKALVPNKYILSAGGAYARSVAAPINGGNTLGVEANLGFHWKIKTLMEVELRAAHVWLGDFYDSSYTNGDSFLDAEDRLNARPTNPWTAFLAFKWLMF
tara:strand:+ start:10476 stop:12080 length:1605 start_codon:yes stop_codon:yes gene_type:complete